MGFSEPKKSHFPRFGCIPREQIGIFSLLVRNRCDLKKFLEVSGVWMRGYLHYLFICGGDNVLENAAGHCNILINVMNDLIGGCAIKDDTTWMVILFKTSGHDSQTCLKDGS